ncbi:alpha/beta fold hydrolase [Burkholderia seminalis]|uniref:Alpha/beta hydrolase n=2 Tax=Burkholderia cepacia complex TaxID=87882 RepID=A0A8A8DF21_9BURK|nr:alpha/beta hydrolase [Burkholderia seminalis]QTO23394.1 alpha/beta hydrolase [Burkholderia seminalis]
MDRRVEYGKEAWFVTSTGAKLFYRDFAPAQPVGAVPLLCLHGFMRNSRDFCELGRTFAAKGVRVVAPDLRGRGFSARYSDAKDYHYDLVVRDVKDLLDHLDIGPVVVVGVALGGIIAIDMAGESGTRVAGIVLNDLGAEIVEHSAQKMAGNVDASDFSFDEAVARVKLQFGKTYPDLPDECWVDLMLRAYRELTPGRYARDLDLRSLVDAQRMKVERPDLWPQFLATRGVPVALLRGETSDFFTADCAERMVEAHADTVLTTVKGRGHPPLLDEPESLAAIEALLQRASRR